MASVVNNGNLNSVAIPTAANPAFVGNVTVGNVPFGGYYLGGLLTGAVGAPAMNSVDFGISHLQRLLFAGLKTASQMRLDVVYPYEYNLCKSENIFHLLVWRLSDESRNKNFWNIIYSRNINNLTANNIDILFCSREYRTQFQKWLVHYSMKNFNGNDISTCFVPTIETGRLSGYLVKDTSNLHLINLNSHDFLPAWVWIVNNCKKSVFRMSNGWLFTSEKDACSFKLFDVANMKLSEIE